MFVNRKVSKPGSIEAQLARIIVELSEANWRYLVVD